MPKFKIWLLALLTAFLFVRAVTSATAQEPLVYGTPYIAQTIPAPLDVISQAEPDTDLAAAAGGGLAAIVLLRVIIIQFFKVG